MRFHTAAALSWLVCVSSLALAQREKEPRRPRMDAGADTNDAQAYYRFAHQLLTSDPDKSADALYWAARLEPTMADAYYARRVALLLTEPSRLANYWSGNRRTIQSDDIKRIDSLFYHALTLNPFVSQTLERELFESIANDIARRYEREGGGTASEVRFLIDRETSRWPASSRAWLAYGDGRYGDALVLYAQAIHDDKRNGPLHADRGRIFYQMNRPDSALAELNVAIEDLRKRDKKELIYVYQSKALTEHSIAVVEQTLGHLDAAREAYGRALQEDLSYYPAHRELALMALDAKDTTTALTEMDLAVQLRADDAIARYLYGYTLFSTGRYSDAEVQLRKAVELNPVYAAPRFVLAQTLEKAGKPADALVEYRGFMARASRTNGRSAAAQARIAELSTGAGSPEKRP